MSILRERLASEATNPSCSSVISNHKRELAEIALAGGCDIEWARLGYTCPNFLLIAAELPQFQLLLEPLLTLMSSLRQLDGLQSVVLPLVSQ